MVNDKKECTTRRKFCKKVAGVAFTGAFAGLETMAVPNPESQGEAAGNGELLAAACGTYCGACPAYLAKHGKDEQIRKKRQMISSSAPTEAQKGIPPSNWIAGLRQGFGWQA